MVVNKHICLLAVLALCSSLYAQDAAPFNGQDLMTIFEQYNPSVLQKTTDNERYQSILNKLTAAYSAPRTEQNELEMIALAMNFDNSIRLEALKQSYIENRTLQTVMGADLASLEKVTQESLLPIVQDIFKNTLAVKNIQIKRYKKQIKFIKANKTLSAQEKAAQVSLLKSKIAQVKKEISSLKKNSKQSIQDAADVYLIEMRSEYEAAMHQTSEAEQSDTHDVKADHKKPVAQ